jgi:hypothetical protein
MCVVFFTWFFSSAIILNNVKKVFEVLLLDQGSTLFENQTSMIYYYNLPLEYLVFILINRYGIILLLFFTIGFLLIINFKKFIRTNNNYLVSVLLLSIIFSAFSLLGYTGEYDIGRISRFVLWLAPLLVPLFMFINVHTNKINKIIPVFLFLLIILGVFNFGAAPWNNSTNAQLNSTDICAAQWYLSNEDGYDVATMVMNVNYINYYLFGIDSTSHTIEISNYKVQSHFGYYEEATPFKNISVNIIMFERALTYASIYPDGIRAKANVYDDVDIMRLYCDADVNIIYNTGKLKVINT